MPKSKRPISKIKKDLILSRYYFSLLNNKDHTDTSFCKKNKITRTSLNNWMNSFGGKDLFMDQYEELAKSDLITDEIKIIKKLKNIQNDLTFTIIGFFLMTVIAIGLILERSIEDGYLEIVIITISISLFLIGIIINWNKK